MSEYIYQTMAECDCPYASCEVTGECLAVRITVLEDKIAKMKADLVGINRWKDDE